MKHVNVQLKFLCMLFPLPSCLVIFSYAKKKSLHGCWWLTKKKKRERKIFFLIFNGIWIEKKILIENYSSQLWAVAYMHEETCVIKYHDLI